MRKGSQKIRKGKENKMKEQKKIRKKVCKRLLVYIKINASWKMLADICKESPLWFHRIIE